jgi:hypothetical protein
MADNMNVFKSLFGAAALALVAGNASANVVYDWMGTCTELCTGNATAVLTLADTYTPGTAVANADFLSFSFSSSNGSYTVPGDTVFSEFTSGSSLPDFFGATGIYIDYPGSGTYFQHWSNGAWNTMIGGSELAVGQEGSWTLRTPAVPLPASLPLLLAGVAGMGALSRRRKG